MERTESVQLWYWAVGALLAFTAACGGRGASQSGRDGSARDGSAMDGSPAEAFDAGAPRADRTPDEAADVVAPVDAVAPSDAAAPIDAVAPSDAVAPVDAAIDSQVVDARSDAAPPTADGGATPLRLFYLDVQGRVMTTSAEGSTPRVLVAAAGQGPDGLAVDVTAGYLYWTGMGVPSADDGFVRRAALDGSNVTTLVPAGGTYTPKQLRLDRAGGKLYWSDREGMRVQRANLDGSGIETILTVAAGATARADAANWCVGIALDVAGGWFYWTQKGPDNGGVGSIRRAHLRMPAGQTDLNRSDVEVLFAGLPEPIDVEVDVDAGYLYWTDRGDDTVNRGPIVVPSGTTASSRRDRQILVRGVREAIGIALDLPRGRLFYTSATGQVGTARLDGTGARDLLTGAGALTGIAVVELP